ncbi:MAG: hypothetical protein DA408_06400 [Bacteroidetes bacterium]|nr:MAG: hypothetical protein C7N36_15660 [Bacteroidota bacterium]PTM13473.1 MAG: hypothetical protein DA408_06400 [Bacteroidota bacterium]
MNLIPDRVYSFLKEYPPFSMLDQATLLDLAEKAVIQYLQPQEFVFRAGEAPKAYVYVVREGAIQLLQQDEHILVEVCDEGDSFGLRPLLADSPYVLSAQATEETLLYALRIDNLQLLIESNPKVGFYLAQNFAWGINGKYNQLTRGKLPADHATLASSQPSLFEIQSIQHSKTPVTCHPATSIQQVANIMQQQQVGSIVIVDKNQHPVGIVTDRDLRNRVVTGEIAITEPIATIIYWY